MKNLISNILTGVVGLASAVCLWSCVAEDTFESDGEGTVKLTTVLNSITTRADETQSDPLRENCVVYISNEKGLIYKEKGLDNIKESFSLKVGKYVAEAWTGDSVSASFDKKFYRGYEPFTVTKGSESNVVVNCRIANVVASINTNTIDPNLMKDDYQITIKNSRGELTFDKDNAAYEKAYFMMPNGDTSLEYIITGTNIDGQSFTKPGKIENVQPAHHYILNFEYNPDETPTTQMGAVFIKIHIKDEEITDSKVEPVNTRPTITSFRYNLDKQFNFINDEDIPETLDLQICGFKGLKYINISSSTSASQLEWPSSTVNILNENNNTQQLQNSGVVWNVGELNPETNVITATVSFPKALFEKLSSNMTSEHLIKIAVEDEVEPYEPTEITLRIVRNADAIVIEDPIEVEQINPEIDCMSITPHSISIPFSLADSFEGTPGVEYSKASENNWTFVAAPLTSNKPSIRKAPKKECITITGLEAGTAYKYRAACGEFHSEQVMTFTTESKFVIPNGSFEEWSTYSASTLLGTKTVDLPGNTGNKLTSFWGSGNEGAATANKVLTKKSSDMAHSGQYSARLGSDAAMGIIAAGNIFVGYYKETDGTNGVLSVGKEYNGSHPSKVRVYANYRPGGNCSIKDGNQGFVDIKSGGTDQGQIYIALTDEPVEIRTNPEKRKLFDKNDSHVLAYGEVTWKEAFGPDGELQILEIPFEYNDRAKTKRPTHLVIVASASKFGDYFCGSKTSVMYLDDFELIYE